MQPVDSRREDVQFLAEGFRLGKALGDRAKSVPSVPYGLPDMISL
jgi:hypothetical protein